MEYSNIFNQINLFDIYRIQYQQLQNTSVHGTCSKIRPYVEPETAVWLEKFQYKWQPLRRTKFHIKQCEWANILGIGCFVMLLCCHKRVSDITRCINMKQKSRRLGLGKKPQNNKVTEGIHYNKISDEHHVKQWPRIAGMYSMVKCKMKQAFQARLINSCIVTLKSRLKSIRWPLPPTMPPYDLIFLVLKNLQHSLIFIRPMATPRFISQLKLSFWHLDLCSDVHLFSKLFYTSDFSEYVR